MIIMLWGESCRHNIVTASLDACLYFLGHANQSGHFGIARNSVSMLILQYIYLRKTYPARHPVIYLTDIYVTRILYGQNELRNGLRCSVSISISKLVSHLSRCTLHPLESRSVPPEGR